MTATFTQANGDLALALRCVGCSVRNQMVLDLVAERDNMGTALYGTAEAWAVRKRRPALLATNDENSLCMGEMPRTGEWRRWRLQLVSCRWCGDGVNGDGGAGRW